MKTRIRVINCEGVYFASPVRKDYRENIGNPCLREIDFVTKNLIGEELLTIGARSRTINIPVSIADRLFGNA